MSFFIIFLKSLESIDPKKLAWEVVATRLLNEMEKKNIGQFESSPTTSLILAQKKFKSKGSRDKIKDIHNYYKKLGHWIKECKKRKVNWKKKSEQNDNVSEVNDELKSDKAFMFTQGLFLLDLRHGT